MATLARRGSSPAGVGAPLNERDLVDGHAKLNCDHGHAGHGSVGRLHERLAHHPTPVLVLGPPAACSSPQLGTPVFAHSSTSSSQPSSKRFVAAASRPCPSSCCPRDSFPIPQSAPIHAHPPTRWGRTSPPNAARTLTPTASSGSFFSSSSSTLPSIPSTPSFASLCSASSALFPPDLAAVPDYSHPDRAQLDSFVRSLAANYGGDIVSHKTFFHDTTKLDHFISLPHTGNHGHALSSLVSRVVEAWLRTWLSGGGLIDLDQPREESQRRLSRQGSAAGDVTVPTDPCAGPTSPRMGGPGSGTGSRRSSSDWMPTRTMNVVEMLLWKLGEDKKNLVGVSKIFIQVQRSQQASTSPPFRPTTPPDVDTLSSDCSEMESMDRSRSCSRRSSEAEDQMFADAIEDVADETTDGRAPRSSLSGGDAAEGTRGGSCYPAFYGRKHLAKLMQSRVVKECMEEFPCLHDMVVVVRHDSTGTDRADPAPFAASTSTPGKTQVWIYLDGMTRSELGMDCEEDIGREMVVRAEI